MCDNETGRKRDMKVMFNVFKNVHTHSVIKRSAQEETVKRRKKQHRTRGGESGRRTDKPTDKSCAESQCGRQCLPRAEATALVCP